MAASTPDLKDRLISPAFPLAIAIAMLCAALWDPRPYVFYELLRWAVSAACAYAAYCAYRERYIPWFWTLAATAILFNPVAPLHLSRTHWRPLNVLTIAVLVAALLWLSTPQWDGEKSEKEPDWLGGVYLISIAEAVVFLLSHFDVCGTWENLALIPAIPFVGMFFIALGSLTLPRFRRGRSYSKTIADSMLEVKCNWAKAPRALLVCTLLIGLNCFAFAERYSYTWYSSDPDSAGTRRDNWLGWTQAIAPGQCASDEGQD